MRNRPFDHAEGRRLRGAVPSDFEAFYRAELRFRAGRRISSADLGRRYAAWAQGQDAQSLNARQIKRAMENIGHRHRKSNGIYYADAAWSDELPGLEDNFPPAGPIAPDQVPAVVQRLDAIMAELRHLRSEVATA
jgi:hypothetical protein